MKLASVRLITRDVPALAAFYARVLQTSFEPNEDFVELDLSGDTALAISSERVVTRLNPDAAAAANRSAILEFTVADVDAERARLDAHVTTWVQEPIDRPWGNRSMFFRDPNGNLLNFYSRLSNSNPAAIPS